MPRSSFHWEGRRSATSPAPTPSNKRDSHLHHQVKPQPVRHQRRIRSDGRHRDQERGIEKENRKTQRRGSTPPPEEPQQEKQPGQGGGQRQQRARQLRGVASGPELLAVHKGPHGARGNPRRSDRIGARPQAGRDEPAFPPGLRRASQQPRRDHQDELGRRQPVGQQNRGDPQGRQQPPDRPALLERQHEKDQHQRQQCESGDVRPFAIDIRSCKRRGLQALPMSCASAGTRNADGESSE